MTQKGCCEAPDVGGRRGWLKSPGDWEVTLVQWMPWLDFIPVPWVWACLVVLEMDWVWQVGARDGWSSQSKMPGHL